jgi:hypothetical protein
MKLFLIGLICAVGMSCTNLQKDKDINDWEIFSRLEIGKDSQETIKRKFGVPDEIYAEQLGPNEEQWNYFRKKIPKIHMLFINGTLQSASIDVWSRDTLTDLTYLLSVFSGDWKVVKEEPVSVHFMPFQCYLVDESSGKRIEIHAYKKIAESISRWNPQMPQKKSKKLKKYPDVDENRCAWLVEFIKK